MTTIFSMAGKDPNTGGEFALKFADTRQTISYSNGDEVPDDVSSKIVLPARTQYAFSRCGNNECANEGSSSNNKRSGKYIELQKSYTRIADACNGDNAEIYDMVMKGLTCGQVKEIDEMNIIQKQYDEDRSTSFIFTTYKGDIAIYDVSNKGVAKRTCRVFKGTGGGHARDVVKASIKCGDDEVGSFTIEDGICVAMRAMEIANHNDEKYTGGHVDVAILTKSGARHFRHMKKLDGAMKESYIQEIVKRKLQEGPIAPEDAASYSETLRFLRGSEQYGAVNNILENPNPKSLANALNYIEEEHYKSVIDALIETDSIAHLEMALANRTLPGKYKEIVRNYLSDKFSRFDALFDHKAMKIIKFY